jgi:hypothetical protein
VDVPQRRVPFLAPLFTTVTAPIARALGRELAGTILSARAAEIECPRCRDVIALWSPTTRLLHFPARNGIGPPLADDQTANVDICCARCGKTWAAISSRAVGRNLHNGRPPLGPD